MHDLEVLVTAAAGGGDAAESAWSDLVTELTPVLLRSLLRYRLSEADRADVMQATWLRLLEQLPRIRDPRALPGWLATTSRREALLLLRQSGRAVPVQDVEAIGRPETGAGAESTEEAVERRDRMRQLWSAIRRLPDSDQELLDAFLTTPPPTYRAVARSLGRPLGSIGPTRARCLGRLRRELPDHAA